VSLKSKGQRTRKELLADIAGVRLKRKGGAQ
jgi:hypothetical protein